MSTFTSDKHLLGGILGNIGTGKIQLPDFQRGWVIGDAIGKKHIIREDEN